MSAQKNLIVSALLILAAAGLDAQGTVTLVQQRQGIRLAEPLRPANTSGDTKIIGQVVDIRQVPVAYARVQLRSLINGTVQQESSADGNGKYQFLVDTPGTYVVEMVQVDGYILALSNAATLARFETLQTVVQLPGRWDATRMVMPQHLTNFIGMSAANTMTAQTVKIAFEQSIQPVDAGEPVSPFKP
jgi:hypothetical protein